MSGSFENALKRYDFKIYPESEPVDDKYYAVMDGSRSGHVGSAKWCVESKSWENVSLPGSVVYWAKPSRIPYAAIDLRD